MFIVFGHSQLCFLRLTCFLVPDQQLVYSREQKESIGLVRRCYAMVGEVKRLTGMNWSSGLRQ